MIASRFCLSRSRKNSKSVSRQPGRPGDWSYIQLLQLFFRPVFEQGQQPPIFVVSVAVPSETQESDDCYPKRCLCKVLRPEFGSLVRPEQKCAPIAEHENRDSNALRFDRAM